MVAAEATVVARVRCSTRCLRGLSAWRDAATFAILIIVLLVKPTGILGRQVQEKV